MTKSDALKEVFRGTKIKDVMMKRVKTLYEDEELSQAQKIFADSRTFYIPVVTRAEKLTGLLSHKYLYRTQSPRKFVEGDVFYEPGLLIEGDSYYDKDMLDSYILRKMMQRNPSTMKSEDSLAEAVVIMVKRNLGCVVIVDDNNSVVGLLTDREVLSFIAKAVED